ncbi:hypothetical protein EYF80_029244 [Liparis tanakae]|uniref:Uncharacterized protein n=1 Tax=Liparis tanakae TaxID=230148 RepID=A0A4Z2H4G8_9TELE|nr:hypothetical protein EYF80_029244 [Liparis tanakae]
MGRPSNTNQAQPIISKPLTQSDATRRWKSYWNCSLRSRPCDPVRCPLPSSTPVVNAGAPQSGPAAVVAPPHCVLPEASARTRCRQMASSRNPATFSLSSCTRHLKKR